MPPSSRLPAIRFDSPLNVRQVAACAVSPSFAPERFCTARVPGSSPGTVGRLDLRRLSTSAIATVLEHDRGRDHHPHASPGVTPLLAWFSAASRLATRRWLSCHGSRGRRVLCSAAGASRRTKRGSFTPARSARTPHVTSPCPRSAGEAERGLYGTEVPTSTPADSARPSAQGLHHPTFREEGRDPRTRGAFHRWAAPKGWLRDSTGCHQPVE